MDDLAFLRERIESYADYTNDAGRQRSDEQIRAYVGEALARGMERLRPTDTAADATARVMLRCQFADFTLVRAFDGDELRAERIAAIHAADRDLVALADESDARAAADWYRHVVLIDAALDRRSRVITGGDDARPEVGTKP